MNAPAIFTPPAPAASAADSKPRILCVDDEPRVLESLSLLLRRRYEVQAQTSAEAALDLIRQGARFAVVISDMRMPGMDGATFLRNVREIAPDMTRLLLTGQSDLQSAMSAVNEGGIFRFLSKPCSPETLQLAIEAAVEQHRLINAERDLLEHTLHGSILALTDALALTNPLAFGRASRVHQLVSEMGRRLATPMRWQVEIAAMLSELGSLALSPEIVEKIYYGRPLDAEERKLAARCPAVVQQLLGRIPRLELVREMLAMLGDLAHVPARTLDPSQLALVQNGAAQLRLAVEFDRLEAQGTVAADAVDLLRGQNRHPETLLEALAAVRGARNAAQDVRELPLTMLRAGMVIAEDVRLESGALLVARGFKISAGFVERVAGLRPGACKALIRVIIPPAGAVTD